MINHEPEISAQALLQTEARDVVEQIQLASALTRAGAPVQLGSSVLGLMTWRDIDFHVYCDPLDPAVCYEALRPVAANPGLLRLTFSNRLGDRRRPSLSRCGRYMSASRPRRVWRSCGSSPSGAIPRRTETRSPAWTSMRPFLTMGSSALRRSSRIYDEQESSGSRLKYLPIRGLSY
jgi:hypothetical protein